MSSHCSSTIVKKRHAFQSYTRPKRLPGQPGIGDEYNDDTGESDDGDAQTNAIGFRYPSEAAGIERRAEEGAAGADEGTGDRRWHDMYK